MELRRRASLGWLALLLALSPAAALAQHISIDGTLSPARTLVGPNYAIGANLGKQVGGNLFQSFGKFGLATGESATFSGPATIGNVIGRVTGGTPSLVNGRIRSTIAGANLYLINPSGMVFGPKATVNVSGSFHASTANYLKMADGARFRATMPNGSTLSAAPPAAFGFLNARPAAITVNGGALGPVAGTLGLVGGRVAITGSKLVAPGGTIQVTSVAGAGEVPVDARKTSALTVRKFGTVGIAGGSALDVANQKAPTRGGGVFIRAGTVTIAASEIDADNFGAAAGGRIALRADRRIAIASGADVHAFSFGRGAGADIDLTTGPGGAFSAADDSSVLTGSGGSGAGGRFSLDAGRLALTGGAALGSLAEGSGTAGAVAITGNSMVVDGRADNSNATEIGSRTASRGRAGDVTVRAGSLSILGNGEINSITFGPGDAGAVSIDVAKALSIDAGSSPLLTGISTQSNDSASTGNAGSLSIAAGSLAIDHGGQITGSTSGAGTSGDVSIAVKGRLSIDGAGAAQGTGIFANTTAPKGGDGGDIAVTAASGRILTNGEISSSTLGSGDAGSVSVRIKGALTIDGSRETGLTGIASNNADTAATGNAGKVSVAAQTLTLSANGEISSSTLGAGNGGEIAVTASKLAINDGEISSDSAAGSVGNAGDVSIAAGSLSLLNGFISSDSLGSFMGKPASDGNAGRVGVTAQSLTITGDAGIESDTAGRGQGGEVGVSARDIVLRGGGFISSEADASGAGGDVTVNAARSLLLDSTASEQSAIDANGFGTGKAGEVKVSGRDITLRRGSFISSEADGSGAGGDVTVRATHGLLLDSTGSANQTAIDADGFGRGKAGEVAVSAGNITLRGGSFISSQAAGTGAGGDVRVGASGSLLLDSRGSANQSEIDASTFGPGKAGRVAVSGGDITLRGGSFISSDAGSSDHADRGNAGQVRVTATGTILVDGAGAIGANSTEISSNTQDAGSAGSVAVTATSVELRSAGRISSDARSGSSGNAGSVSIGADRLTLSNGTISSDSKSGSRGNAGEVRVAAGTVTIDGNTGISSDTAGPGKGGEVGVTAHDITLRRGAFISSEADGSGAGGGVTVKASGSLLLDSAGSADQSAIEADGFGRGRAGEVAVSARAITLRGGSFISSQAAGTGAGGDVTVGATRGLLVDSTGSANQSEIDASTFGPGRAGRVAVSAGNIALRGGSFISSDASSSSPADRGNAGTVTVAARGTILIDGTGAIDANPTEISSNTQDGGSAGSVVIGAREVDLEAGGRILSDSEAGSSGNAGKVSIGAGRMIIDDGLVSTGALGGVGNLPASTGNAGDISVDVAGSLSIVGGASGFLRGIGSNANPGTIGNAGDVRITAGALSIAKNGEISSGTFAAGRGGRVVVDVAGRLRIDAAQADQNFLTGIASQTNPGGAGSAGDVRVTAGSIALLNGGAISSAAIGATDVAPASTGNAGAVRVTARGVLSIDGPGSAISSSTGPGTTGRAGSVDVDAGTLSITDNGAVSGSTSGRGAGGDVAVTVAGALVIDGTPRPAGATGIFARANDPFSAASAGRVSVVADSLAISGGGLISTSTFGNGNAGDISVSAAGSLTIDGAASAGFVTGIASSTNLGAGNAGRIAVAAGSLDIADGGEIQSLTFTSGRGGDITVATGGNIAIHGAGNVQPTGILTDALAEGGGAAGAISLVGANITLAAGGVVSSGTDGAGNGGTVQVAASDSLSLSGAGSGITASAAPTASGNAGSVTVAAPAITVADGAEIASTTAGAGAGGSVAVMVAGPLLLAGGNNPATQIAASATGPKSGPGGAVTVGAGSLVIEGGAQIASTTAGPGAGGKVDINVAGIVVLPDAGPQISARSTGSGDAGSVALSAFQLIMNKGAAVSTEASATTANGGNISLSLRDFLYLTSSEVTTSVKGETGNGGNIAIDPQFVVLNHSSIIAEAIAGHGGDISIEAGHFIASADSIVSASSQLGISGAVVINGPLVNLNGTLVVLSSELRSAVALTRDGCAAQGNRLRSSLVEAGRGGLPQDPEATLPALYLAGRDLGLGPRAAAPTGTAAVSAVPATIHLTMRCG